MIFSRGGSGPPVPPAGSTHGNSDNADKPSGTLLKNPAVLDFHSFQKRVKFLEKKCAYYVKCNIL